MKCYPVQRVGRLLVTKAAITGSQGTKVLNLLVDTGSTYTIVPSEALEAIGCSPAISKQHVRVVTGSGHLIVPLLKIPKFHCLGYLMEDFEVVAHTLPPESVVDGLVGMDFLQKLKAIIHTDADLVEVTQWEIANKK